MPMGAIDQIVAHYKDNQRQSMEVPEWGLTLYWDLLTPARLKELGKRCKDDVDFIAEMARDAAGNKLFDAEAKLRLRDCADVTIIGRIGRRMIQTDTVEGAEKN